MPVASSSVLSERPPRSYTSDSSSTLSGRSKYRSDLYPRSYTSSSFVSSYRSKYDSNATSNSNSSSISSTSTTPTSRYGTSSISASVSSKYPSTSTSSYYSKSDYGTSSYDSSSTPTSSYVSRYGSSRPTTVNTSPPLVRRRERDTSERSYQTLPRGYSTTTTRNSRETSPSGYSSRTSEVSSPRSYSPALSRRSSRVDLYRRLSRDGSTLQDELPKEVKPTGLRNLGNTCFMNSVIQCLYHTKALQDYLISLRYQSDINTTTCSMKGDLVKGFADLLKSLSTSSSSAVSSLEFKRQIERFAPRFTGYSQQDAQEFLRYLAYGIHEDVNRVKTRPTPITTEIDDDLSDSEKAKESWKRYLAHQDSMMVDLFVGQLKSTLTCTTCGYKSVTFDPFWDLSLPIPNRIGRVTLNQCLASFLDEETLEGDEKPTCAKCKTRRVCTKSFSIHKLPKVLVLHLKRFSPHERYRSKLTSLVDFPVDNLNLARYASNDVGTNYRLYAVSNHRGTPMSGHYTAICRQPSSSKWFLCDDTSVISSDERDIVREEAYILFYEQTNI